MPLEIRHNRAEHTHENEQFRRVAISLKNFFDQYSLDGLFIGNPYSESFPRFRADAVLLYSHGVVIIDFKDYSGEIILPSDDETFKSSKWYSEDEFDKKRIEIKAGSKFINPFRQLQSYRGDFFEIVEQNIYLNKSINPRRTLALNIFSGPLTIQNSVPKNVPYYKIVQESNLPTVLYDYSSENGYSEDCAKALNSIFPAKIWHDKIVFAPPSPHVPEPSYNTHIEFQTEINEFLKQSSSGILILESLIDDLRDKWMQYILSESTEYNIPQTECWCHSSRIARKIEQRSGISQQGLYGVIYGGSTRPADESAEDHLQENVPLKASTQIDESAVVILQEAHLVTRSLHQSEILKFGSGRLLEDLIEFLNLNNSNRKLVCIGDPYSLSYGNSEESALNSNVLSELFEGEIFRYKSSLRGNDKHGNLQLRTEIASSLDNNTFNYLQYPWFKQDLIKTSHVEATELLRDWFSTPSTREPNAAVLVFSSKNEGARKTNNWIKRNCLRNGDSLAVDDLLVANNNVNVPDPTGFGQPSKIYNGMYLRVVRIGERKQEPVKIKTNNEIKDISLDFIKLSVACLSLEETPETEVWLFNNDFISENGLSKEEQIAFRIFVNNRVSAALNLKPFESSNYHALLNNSSSYIEATNILKGYAKKFENNERVKTKIKQAEQKVKGIERKYHQEYRKKVFFDLTQTDPMINALMASYGWALTVHKAVGSTFGKVILNANQGESRGITNSGYYRWLYSALATSNSKTHVINPISVNPLMNCEFEDVADNWIEIRKPLLKFINFQPNKDLKKKIPNDLNHNVIGTISEFSSEISRAGYILDDVISHSPYLTRVIFINGVSNQDKIMILIDNKGDKEERAVSSIRIDTVDKIDRSTVEAVIDNIFSSASQDDGTYTILDFPNDFRGNIYKMWQQSFKNMNIDFTMIGSHDNHDLFQISDTFSQARFRVWYRPKKGFFTKVSVFKKSGDGIVEKLSEMISTWNQNSN